MVSATLSIDNTALDRATDRAVRQYLSAGSLAVAETTKALERDLEAMTRGAVPGQLWRAWGSNVFPKGGRPARDPVGTVFVNGGRRSKGAITFWSQPGSVRGSRGQFLAIPTPAAGSRGRARDLTPGEWERRHGQRLRFVYRPGRPSLLVADNASTTSGGRVSPSRSKKIGPSLKGATVVIFVLVPMVKFRNAFAIAPAVARAEGALVANFFRAVGRNSVD